MIDLDNELHGFLKRYFPDVHPCYRTALFHCCYAACMLFDRYSQLFHPPDQACPEDPLRDECDPDDCAFVPDLTSLLNSPHLLPTDPADPDPRPKPPKQTGRHREPPPPPRS